MSRPRASAWARSQARASGSGSPSVSVSAPRWASGLASVERRCRLRGWRRCRLRGGRRCRLRGGCRHSGWRRLRGGRRARCRHGAAPSPGAGRPGPPQPLARRQPGCVDLRRQPAPHVPEVPGLVLVAGSPGAPGARVAQDPAIAPAVASQPGSGPRPAPIRVGPGCGTAGGLEIDGGSELVLRVARPCRRQQRSPVAHAAHPAPEGRDLRAVAAVRGLDRERRAGRPRGAGHRGEVTKRDAPDPPEAAHARPRDAHEVAGRIRPGQAKARVKQAAVPVGRRPVSRERVADSARRCHDGLGGPGRLARGQHDHARQHGEQQTALRRGDTHAPERRRCRRPWL